MSFSVYSILYLLLSGMDYILIFFSHQEEFHYCNEFGRHESVLSRLAAQFFYTMANISSKEQDFFVRSIWRISENKEDTIDSEFDFESNMPKILEEDCESGDFDDIKGIFSSGGREKAFVMHLVYNHLCLAFAEYPELCSDKFISRQTKILLEHMRYTQLFNYYKSYVSLSTIPGMPHIIFFSFKCVHVCLTTLPHVV